jgi:hypothetical protein
MALKNIIITGSIGSIPTEAFGQKYYVSSTDQQSFPIERITGSSAGAFPELNGNISSSNLFANVTQSWVEVFEGPTGLSYITHETQEEFINGEFSGSELIVTTQRLVDEDCISFLKVNTTSTPYNTKFFYSSGSNGVTSTSLSSFLSPNLFPGDGDILLHYSIIAAYDPGGIEPPPPEA